MTTQLNNSQVKILLNCINPTEEEEDDYETRLEDPQGSIACEVYSSGGIHQDLQQCHAQSHVSGRGNA